MGENGIWFNWTYPLATDSRALNKLTGSGSATVANFAFLRKRNGRIPVIRFAACDSAIITGIVSICNMPECKYVVPADTRNKIKLKLNIYFDQMIYGSGSHLCFLSLVQSYTINIRKMLKMRAPLNWNAKFSEFLTVFPLPIRLSLDIHIYVCVSVFQSFTGKKSQTIHLVSKCYVKPRHWKLSQETKLSPERRHAFHLIDAFNCLRTLEFHAVSALRQ